MGALTDQHKRSCHDLRLPVCSSFPKKRRLNMPSESVISSHFPQLSPLLRTVHGPQRIIRAFGLGSSPIRKCGPSRASEIGNFSEQSIGQKQDDKLALEEYKKLVEEHFSSPCDRIVKVNTVRQKSSSPELATVTDTVILDDPDAKTPVEENVRNVALELAQAAETKIFAKSEPLYKELYRKTKERDPFLNNLALELKLLQLKAKSCWIETKVLRKREEESKEELEYFRPLTTEEEEEISRSFFIGSSHKVLVVHKPSNIEITREVMQCLMPGAWLNDEAINLYLELLKEREKREPKKFLKCHFFNTFFYKKLISEKLGYDFKAVKRWTTHRKLGYALIDCDKIFVPIHKEIHWCLAVINMKDKSFEYLDSLGGLDNYALKKLARYLKEEIKDKSSKEIDTLSWKRKSVDELPLQKNGWDCGMFMLKYADFYSRGLKLCFGQEHMPYFRKRTALEILRLYAE